MTEEELKKIKDSLDMYKKFIGEPRTITFFKEFFDAVDRLYNEYINLKEIEEAHKAENGELRAELNGKVIHNLEKSKVYLDD